jgi:hypothetical protein
MRAPRTRGDENGRCNARIDAPASHRHLDPTRHHGAWRAWPLDEHPVASGCFHRDDGAFVRAPELLRGWICLLVDAERLAQLVGATRSHLVGIRLDRDRVGQRRWRGRGRQLGPWICFGWRRGRDGGGLPFALLEHLAAERAAGRGQRPQRPQRPKEEPHSPVLAPHGVVPVRCSKAYPLACSPVPSVT